MEGEIGRVLVGSVEVCLIQPDLVGYLRHFVSGVPFDGQQQLWKGLWHVNAVMPAGKQVKQAETQVSSEISRKTQQDQKTATEEDNPPVLNRSTLMCVLTCVSTGSPSPALTARIVDP